jgi:ribosomal protein L30/L7E
MPSSIYPLKEVARAAPRYFRLRVVKSLIGLPHWKRKWALSLGIKRRDDIRYVEVNQCNMSLILKLKEILKVSTVDEVPLPRPVRKGYTVIGQFTNPWACM